MRPTSPAAILAAALLAACAPRPSLAAPPALRWTVDAARPAPAEWVLLRGETRLLEPTLQEARIPVAWPSNTVATLYWQTNGMGTAWWTAPASLGTSTGQLSAVWSATNDVGASAYAYFVGAETTDGRTYSAHGTIRYRHGPGAEPNALPLPVQALDFAVVVVTNEPWATPADLAAVATNAQDYADARFVPLSGNVFVSGRLGIDTRHYVPTGGVLVVVRPAAVGGETVTMPWSEANARWETAGATVSFVSVDAGAGIPQWKFDDTDYSGLSWLGPYSFLRPDAGAYTNAGMAACDSVVWTNASAQAGHVSVVATANDVAEAISAVSWPSLDTATNILWTVTVSNGHWLITGTEVTP